LFLNSTSDATLLETLFRAASAPIRSPVEEEMQSDCEELGMEPLFVRGVSDDV